jgi:NAD(P)-dependent dehydrogenase (short-subunit alcohol dehydrogenase family)
LNATLFLEPLRRYTIERILRHLGSISINRWKITMGLLEGKVCIISGGAGSIGRASASRFLDEGASVMLLDLDNNARDDAASALRSDRIATAVCDVTDSGQVDAAFAAAKSRWGRADVIFSNAGNPGFIAPLADYPEDAFDRTLQIHAKGAFLACKHGQKYLGNGGSIVITSSLAGVRGGGGGNIGYVAAKHAQIGIMRAAARGLAARSIRVNTINPGPIDNEFQTGIEVGMSKMSGINVTEQLNRDIPLKRHARPDEIAQVALFLASDLSSYVTGAVLMVDGGMMS